MSITDTVLLDFLKNNSKIILTIEINGRWSVVMYLICIVLDVL